MNCQHCHSEIPDEAIFCPRCNTRIEDKEEPSGYRYAAFISYRHLPRDTEVAQQVQKAIETYRLPHKLRASGDASDQHRALGKCFRDEDELAASHSLPNSIRAALAQSRALVVICSPETEKSPWVQREIETFASLHGREHIICVLADGDSTTTIPATLKTQMMPDSQGKMHKMASEPLAADLRTEARSKRKNELLRIIAGVVGCSFDDLRQRDKERRKKRAALIAMLVILVALLIGFLAFQATENSEEALIAKSKSLAAQSEEQLARGERIEAVKTALSALSALPTSENNPNRPIVIEAQTALENALGVNQNSIKLWKPNFSYDTKADIAGFASSAFGEWVAILDDEGNIDVLDMYTRKERAHLNIREYASASVPFDINEWTIKAAGKERFLIANHYGNGSLACFNAEDGTLLWEQPDAVVSALAISEDEESCAIFTTFEDGAVLAGLVRTDSGNIVAYVETPSNFGYDLGIFQPCSYDSKTRTAYIGYGSYACAFFFDEGVIQTAKFEGSMLWSMQGADNVLIGASSNKRVNNDTSESSIERPYFFEACSMAEDTTKALWQNQGVYSVTVAGEAYQSVAYEGVPTIQQIVQEGDTCVACTAGGTLGIYSLHDGSAVYERDFGQSVVSLGTMYGGKGDYLVLALADGTLDLIMPLDPSFTQNTAFRTTIPYQIEQASIANKENGLTVVLLQAANQPNRFLSYTFDAVSINDSTVYSLDELLKMAHQLID